MKLISVRLVVLLAAGLLGRTLPAAAQPVIHLSTVTPGGMPGLPLMGVTTKLTNGVQITWDGPSGYYQVFQASNRLNAPWIALGPDTNLANTAVITRLYSNAFFRVAGPAPKYIGAAACTACHLAVCRYETNTAHASAFTDPAFKALGGQTNAACVPCHTVGYGLATGFAYTNRAGLITYSTNLAGVQCENCHGPAGNHVASEDDPTVRPRVEIAATLCGGCHSASHTTYTNAPTYEEWSASGHAAVVPAVLTLMAASTNNLRSCGVCHSGSARFALLSGQDPTVAVAHDDNVPITCIVCHDPHQTNSVSPFQLRNPVSSTNDFHLADADTASLAAFTNAYNTATNINLCAQCHNDRGASYTDTARAPHGSLQYNFLIGSVGAAAFNPSSHTGQSADAAESVSGTFYLTNQCAACHMQAESTPPGAPGHTFTPAYTVCANCHNGPEAEAFLTPYLSNQVAEVIYDLNLWAARKAPTPLRTNGVVPWEYAAPGGLTWQTDPFGNVTNWTLNVPPPFTGPVGTNQTLIPTNILKARFNLYLVLNDGSFGVHNPIFAPNLLSAAQGFIFNELDP